MANGGERLHQLRKLLNQGHALTQEEIRKRLGLRSVRQVRRLIRDLREGGLDVLERREGRFKRFFLAAEDREVDEVEHVTFNERELFALTVAAEAARAALGPTPLGPPLERAFEKLLERAEGTVLSFEPELQAEHWHFSATSMSRVNPDVFESVARAIRECRSLRIDYFAASSGKRSQGRLIDPYVIAVRGSSWMVVARCHRSQRVLDFSLAGIARAVPEASFFVRPSDFDPDEHFRDRFSALEGDEVHVVRLAVEESKAPYFLRKQYHPSQVIEDQRAEGRLVVSYEVSGLDEIAAFVRSWGPGVHVLDPPLLAARMAEEAGRIAAAYVPSSGAVHHA